MGTDWSAFPKVTFGINQDLPSLDSGWQAFPGHYLLYAASGCFMLEVEDRRWLLPPQRAAWVRADVPIRLCAEARVTSSSILFDRASIPTPDFACRVFAVSPLAREMILYAMQWDMNRDPANTTADQFFVVVAGVCVALAQQPEQFWLPRASSDELVCAIDYILENLGTKLTVEAVAGAVNVSKRTLARRFEDEAQMSCGQFIHRARMLRAMELLEKQPSPVIEVAYAVGFESISAFNAAFRRFSQETPSHYRRRFLPR